MPSEELDEIHCRFTCRGNSCFVECLNHQSKIVVNDRYANRSSLSDGDSIHIGPYEWLVDFESNRLKPQPFQQLPEEDTEFDSLEEIESLVEVMPVGESDVEDLQESVHPEDVPRDALDDDEGGFALDEHSFDFQESENTASNPPQIVESATEVEDTPSLTSSPVGETGWEKLPVDPEPAEKSSDMPEHSTTVAGIELDHQADREATAESTLPDLRDGPSWRLSRDSDIPLATSSDPKASKFLRSLVNRSMLEKKVGDEAVNYLKQRLDDEGARLYQVHHRVIKRVEFSDFETADDGADSIFLVSKLDEEQLRTILDEKRWLGRMEYPLGLQRFLELSPRVCESFFSMISACLFFDAGAAEYELIHSGDQPD